jgi:ABC-type glycerol-3-phosphate transport system substrate-binding protein
MGTRKHSRREFLRLSAAAAMGAVAAACAPKAAVEEAKEKATTPVPKPAEAVELTAWMVDRRTINEMTEKVLAEEFAERQPDIKVDPQFVPSGEVLTKLLAANAAKQAPDLAYIDEEIMYGLMQQGVLRPIPDHMINVREEMGVRINSFYRLPPEDEFYALPQGNMTSAIYYNVDLLDEFGYTWEDIPPTWDEFIPWAKEMTVWEGDELVRTGFAFSGGGAGLSDAIRFQMGGWWFVDDQTCAWAEDASVNAHQFVLDLFDKEKLDSRVGLPVVDMFAQGKAVTAHFWTWRQGFWMTEYPELNWGTIPNITFTGEGPYGRASDDVGFSVTTQREGQDVTDACWTLWRYFVGPDYMRRYVQFRGVHPSLIELWDEPIFSADDGRWRGIAITTAPGNYRAPGVWPAEISDAWSRSWTRMRDEGTPAKEALVDGCAEMEEVLERQEEWPLILGKTGWDAHPEWLAER